MALALSMSNTLIYRRSSRCGELAKNRRSHSNLVFSISCCHEPTGKTQKEDEGLFGKTEKVGKLLKEKLNLDLNPKQKGDWKDLMLMSLSFAVYVYISQQIVSAYFAYWISIPKPSW
ncbi:uncharacterized protein LOC110809318 [Carica papaya]|uniref:uncharacterized protein LOC110809318 n=1 Tax=Carica papaya TaxID=3649 RepID=UPI000B8CE232|nr:uncharacterized protein LOC110809318 [Carica papaya]